MTKPVGPEVARGPSDADLEPWVDAVNLMLTKPWTDYERGNGRWIDVAMLYGSDIARRLIPIFAAQGWNVTYESDQREGSSLRFRP